MNARQITTIALSLAGAIVVGLAVAVVTAIVLAIADIYLSGHGLAPLARPWIDSAFVHLSRADVVLLIVSAIAGLFAGAGIYRARQVVSKGQRVSGAPLRSSGPSLSPRR